MTTAPVKAPQVTREARKFTVEEYFQMVEAGIIQDGERVELIEGEILVMAPMGPSHIGGVTRYARVFIGLAGNLFTVLIQATVRLSERSAPEPDLALVKFREDDYSFAHAAPDDVLLIVEVADSSLNYDRGVKAHIYGRAAIPETWVLNLPGDCLERFTEPGPEGYSQHATLRRGDKVTPVALPDVELEVEALLPPVQSAAEGEE
ncbi:MAG: Uma2 family endonuclease [Chloroflexota bacterium]|nr:Uma2 family endonuclease [Chloroflexota bacterium]